MKPAIWRIFRNGRWSYSDSPSTRSEDRAAWQPLYAATPKCERCGEVSPAHTCTPKPVGWIYEDDEGRMIFSQMPHPDPLWEPVYKAAPKRKWVGLADDEIKSLLWESRVDNLTFARVIEKVLREKNAA